MDKIISNIKMSALTSQNIHNQHTQRSNDVRFYPNETDLTMYISSDQRVEIDINTLGLPEEMINLTSNNEFWKSSIGKILEDNITSFLGSKRLFLGFKNGYFIGFACIEIIDTINEEIKKNYKKSKITKIVVSDDIKKLGKNMKFAVRGSKCKDFKPTKTTTEGIEVFYKCNLHYDEETGKVIRNVSRLEKRIAKKINKKLGISGVRVKIGDNLSQHE